MKKIILLKLCSFWKLLLFSIFVLVPAYSQQDVAVKLTDTDINQLLSAGILSRSINFGDYGETWITQGFFVNLDAATIHFTTGNHATVSASAVFVLVLQDWVPGNEQQPIHGSVVITGDIISRSVENGFKLFFKTTSVDLTLFGIPLSASQFVSKIPEIEIISGSTMLPSVVASYFTSGIPTLSTDNGSLTLYFTATGPREIKAYNEVNQKNNIGSIQEVVSGSIVSSANSPRSFSWNLSGQHQLQTPVAFLDETNGKNKYRNWIKTIDGLIQSETAPRRFQLTVNGDATYKAKFDQAQHVQLSNLLEGNVSGGTVTYDGTTGASFNDYDFKDVSNPHSINTSVPNGTLGANWIFQGWNDGSLSQSRNIVVNNDVNLTAQYKGIHLSNTSSAFTDNGQRKLVRTLDGRLHQVYESLGHVWLEQSTDNGVTWTLGNNNQPLDNGEGKCPSIDWFTFGGYNALVVAFQQRNGNTYTIQISPFSCQNGTYINTSTVYGKSNLLYTETVDPYTTNANPNITRGYGYYDNSFVLTFERKSGSTAGINWFCGKIYDYGFDLNDQFAGPVWISGTNSNSINASVHLNKTNSWPGNFDVVFQQYVSGSSGSIKDVYLYFYKDGQNQWVAIQNGSPFVISSGTGVSNYKPSMVQMPNADIRVCWIRSLNGQPQNSPFSVNVVYWNSATPSQYALYGWLAQSVSLNIRDDNAKTFYAFSQYSMNNQWENYISNGSSYVKLSTAGKDVQLSNGPLSGTSSLMYTSSFYPFTLPYYFTNAGGVGNQLQKTAPTQINYGRGAVLTKGDAQFSYSLKSLTVDNMNIKFIDLPESKTDTAKAFRRLTEKDMYYPNLDSLNAVLLSEPFTIKNNSSISLSEQAGFTDTLAAREAIGANGYVAYTLELVDNATNKTIAAIKSSKFGASNVSLCNLSGSNVNASKVGTKTVRIRITLSTNIPDMQGSLVNEYGTIDDNTLAKMAKDELTLQSPEIITEYALEQNYPNPFNPSTTIHYQLPSSGHITLKVYDMLGREVATLVNEMKESGSYSATFEGARLASGTYIARLTAQSDAGKSFTQTKKMVLMK
jgi:hypothetical protein